MLLVGGLDQPGHPVGDKGGFIFAAVYLVRPEDSVHCESTRAKAAEEMGKSGCG